MATSRSPLFLLLLLPLLLFTPRVDRVGANSGIDPCNSSATSAAGVVFACPQGDGTELATGGLTILVNTRDNIDRPVVGIPASDFWLIGCNDMLALCSNQFPISASAPTDINGQTTITGDIAAGGCDPVGVRIVCMGYMIGAGSCGDACVPIKVKSADFNGNLVVNLVDFSILGAGYTSPPQAYNECLDLVSPFGTVQLPDFAKYAAHSGHSC